MKTEFEAQHYYLKWPGALSALILEKHGELKSKNIMNVQTQGRYEKSGGE